MVLTNTKRKWTTVIHMQQVMLACVFFSGCLSIGLVNIVLFYRLSSFDESSSPKLSIPTTLRGFAALYGSMPMTDKKHEIAPAPIEVSACLIVMDDNHFLIEWLAYHYHTANLRHLIVTTDPHSRTSPSKVLDRWRDRMTIQEWNETDFLPNNFEDQVERKSFNEQKLKVLNNHRVRQASFNVECLKEFKRQDRGWTLMIDTDEYLIPKETKTMANNQSNTTRKLPTIPDILGALHIPAGFEHIYSPCLSINRQQFSAGESSNENVQSMVASGFDGKDFQTLRWRNYGFEPEPIETQFDKTCVISRDIPNKVMIDLGRVELDELSSDKNQGNPHKPLAICPENVFSHISKTPFVLNHYVGTPEQWFYRSNDKRGLGYRRARYEDMNERFGVRKSDAIRPWLTDFVAAVGSAEASRLLKNVGKLEPLPEEQQSENGVVVDATAANNRYKIGDLVEVNFAGEGKWYRAEIYAAYSDNYFSVFFPDCTTEIATFAERMRLPADDSSA